MKVLMLGWEYPPHISGGLGTACRGLTQSLSELEVDIDFVVPKLFGGELSAPTVQLVDASKAPRIPRDPSRPGRPGRDAGGVPAALIAEWEEKLKVFMVDSSLTPYLSAKTYEEKMEHHLRKPEAARDMLKRAHDAAKKMPQGIRMAMTQRKSASQEAGGSHAGSHYGTDLMSEVARYATSVIEWGLTRDFDIIHAHDWMTYPAAVALAEMTGKPFVAHIHSLEFDRSGPHGNTKVIEIERLGLTSATRVIAVSHYTRMLVHRIHHVPLSRIAVVHNGVYPPETVGAYKAEKGEEGPNVLFLGRISQQKGPEFFVEAAAQVVPHVPNVKFTMAGSGDMLPRMKRRVHELGLDDKFHFPGFVRGAEVEKAFSTADLYVMPSVSEPFGISALEAISYQCPAIISRQSGVSEVLRHSLKVDYWDVQHLADLIIGVLKYPELRNELISMSKPALENLHWQAAAQKTLRAYLHALAA